MHSIRLALAGLTGLFAIPLGAAVLWAAARGDGLMEVVHRGGPWMFVIAIFLLAQLALVVLATALEHHEPSPLALHVLGPVLVVIAGAAATTVGMRAVRAAVATVDAGVRDKLLFAGASEAAVPISFALAGAGVGLVGVALSGTVAAFAQRGDKTGRAFGGALLVTLAGPLGLWALGRALACAQQMKAHVVLANAPADVRRSLYLSTLAGAENLLLLMHLAVGLVFVLGLGLLALRRAAAPPYARSRPVGLAVGVVLLALGITAAVFAVLQVAPLPLPDLPTG